MSHFTVMVIGKNPGEQLEQFDANLKVNEYENGEVSEKDKLKMMNHYAEQGYKFSSFSECYKRFGKKWNGNRVVKTKMEYGIGTQRAIQTQNGIGYVLGGRWSGHFIRLKPDATSGITGVKSTFDNEVGIDAALKGDIDFEAIRKERKEKAQEYYQKIADKCGGNIPNLNFSGNNS